MSEGPPTSGSGAEPGQPPAQPEVPAGWYPHPTAPGWEAYWTGSAWGSETRPAEAPAPAVPSAAAEAPAAQEGQAAASQQQAAAVPQGEAAAVPQQEAPQGEPEPAAAPAAPAGAAAAAAATPDSERSGSALPVILCVLGALVAIVGSFLPEAKLDVEGSSIDLADNTMVAAGYGIAVIAAALLGAGIAVWAHLKAARSWLPILLGAVIAAIAVYAGTAGLDVTADFPLPGLPTDDATPSTGIFAVGAGGLLMVLGGIGLARGNSR